MRQQLSQLHGLSPRYLVQAGPLVVQSESGKRADALTRSEVLAVAAVKLGKLDALQLSKAREERGVKRRAIS
jgi:hypothetical protein